MVKTITESAGFGSTPKDRRRTSTPATQSKKAPCGANFLIQRGKNWRRRPESNRPKRICNPLHNRFATAPWSFMAANATMTLLREKKEAALPFSENLERDKRLELSTYTLARYRSTN